MTRWPERTLLERMIEKIDVGDCWEWTAAIDRGYGRVGNPGGSNLAHVAMWEELVGPRTPGMVLDHLCRNTRCVNPDHLEEVEPGENTRRSHLGRKPAICRQGHEISDDLRQRRCRVCRDQRKRQWEEARRG